MVQTMSTSSPRPHTTDATGTGASQARVAEMAESAGFSSMYNSVVNGTEDLGKQGKKNDSDSCMEVVSLAKKHCLSTEETRTRWEEFRSFDVKGRGYLSFEEFELAVRKMCNLTAEEDIPSHLLEEQCKKIGIASWVKFEAYLTWAVATAFSEEVMVPDASQRRLRAVARIHGIPYHDLERLKSKFDSYDNDGNGVIDFYEFQKVVIDLVHRGPKATAPGSN